MFRMESFADELLKISSALETGEKLLKSVGKPAAIFGGGALAYHLGSKELEKYRLGRQVYEQMQARQES